MPPLPSNTSLKLEAGVQLADEGFVNPRWEEGATLEATAARGEEMKY